ncbi:EAL domain-containing protein [Marinococcus luteus]|uniref:EAL domain-containing protein n=1 Tax=Marinococcus luteus TaxID=1122204 RepID=UPI002ACC8962|nr:EAL-associated domain-containing protein [Marinococcus luteus]MDZ5782186.1 EAL-associated domain-containing protein [Marinococcus luteus]
MTNWQSRRRLRAEDWVMELDALDVLMNKERIMVYFQPILSADKLEISAYEVLGRFQNDNGGVETLENCFRDPNVPWEYKQEIDRAVHQAALETFVAEERADMIFLNVDAATILGDGGDGLVEFLLGYEERGIAPTSICLELKATDFQQDLSRLKHFMQYAQSAGLSIAIDNLGKEAIHLEQIAYLKPNVLKVDVTFSENFAVPSIYRDVLHSLSTLSRKIGASLLFEKIESFNQLNYAWRNGARYYQGFYLDKPKETFIEKDQFQERMKKDIHHFIDVERKKIEAQIQLTAELNKRLNARLKHADVMEDIDGWTLKTAESLEEMSFRVYVCDREGYQLSGNASRQNGEAWEYRIEERNRNWSWRPYFLENIVRMNFEQRGILSDMYTDFHSDEMIRTYSHPITEDLYVFVDIPYAFLYEKDYLL